MQSGCYTAAWGDNYDARIRLTNTTHFVAFQKLNGQLIMALDNHLNSQHSIQNCEHYKNFRA